jgi:hypothetical protein
MFREGNISGKTLTKEILPKLPNLAYLSTQEEGNSYKMLFSQHLPSVSSSLPSTVVPTKELSKTLTVRAATDLTLGNVS